MGRIMSVGAALCLFAVFGANAGEEVIELLQGQPDVDGGRIAALGYCFGGGVVLEDAQS